MAKKKKSAEPEKKAAEWKTNSFDGALLFLLFHKRRKNFHPSDFSAADIHQHPEFDFGKHNSSNFKRNSQTVANKAIKFEEKGTGLTKEFKKCIEEVLEKRADLLEGVALEDIGKTSKQQEDSDEECMPSDQEEDDVSHVSGAEDEASLSDDLRDPRFENNQQPAQPPIDKTNILSSARRSQSKQPASKPKSKESTSTMVQNNTTNDSTFRDQ